MKVKSGGKKPRPGPPKNGGGEHGNYPTFPGPDD